MKVLVACEFSGIVREAFRRNGHDAWSCDIVSDESEDSRHHIQTDVLTILDQGWDLMIAHPPCTYLSNSGARWIHDKRFPERVRHREEAVDFFMRLYNAPIPRICVENPVGYISTIFRKADQIVHPWMFGHGEKKRTCLWYQNLPHLVPTNIVSERIPKIYTARRSEDRGKLRSISYPGMAEAMAEQWGPLND